MKAWWSTKTEEFSAFIDAAQEAEKCAKQGREAIEDIRNERQLNTIQLAGDLPFYRKRGLGGQNNLSDFPGFTSMR